MSEVRSQKNQGLIFALDIPHLSAYKKNSEAGLL